MRATGVAGPRRLTSLKANKGSLSSRWNAPRPDDLHVSGGQEPRPSPHHPLGAVFLIGLDHVCKMQRDTNLMMIRFHVVIQQTLSEATHRVLMTDY